MLWILLLLKEMTAHTTMSKPIRASPLVFRNNNNNNKTRTPKRSAENYLPFFNKATTHFQNSYLTHENQWTSNPPNTLTKTNKACCLARHESPSAVCPYRSIHTVSSAHLLSLPSVWKSTQCDHQRFRQKFVSCQVNNIMEWCTASWQTPLKTSKPDIFHLVLMHRHTESGRKIWVSSSGQGFR